MTVKELIQKLLALPESAQDAQVILDDWSENYSPSLPAHLVQVLQDGRVLITVDTKALE